MFFSATPPLHLRRSSNVSGFFLNLQTGFQQASFLKPQDSIPIDFHPCLLTAAHVGPMFGGGNVVPRAHIAWYLPERKMGDIHGLGNSHLSVLVKQAYKVTISKAIDLPHFPPPQFGRVTHVFKRLFFPQGSFRGQPSQETFGHSFEGISLSLNQGWREGMEQSTKSSTPDIPPQDDAPISHPSSRRVDDFFWPLCFV